MIGKARSRNPGICNVRRRVGDAGCCPPVACAVFTTRGAGVYIGAGGWSNVTDHTRWPGRRRTAATAPLLGRKLRPAKRTRAAASRPCVRVVSELTRFSDRALPGRARCARRQPLSGQVCLLFASRRSRCRIRPSRLVIAVCGATTRQAAVEDAVDHCLGRVGEPWGPGPSSQSVLNLSNGPPSPAACACALRFLPVLMPQEGRHDALSSCCRWRQCWRVWGRLRQGHAVRCALAPLPVRSGPGSPVGPVCAAERS